MPGQMPPCSIFRGHLKQASLTGLCTSAQEAVGMLFPHFFAERSVSDTLRDVGELGARISGRDAEARLRRYSGSFYALSSLPRQRYFSLCLADGTDYETLGRELLAYGDFSHQGPFVVADLAYEDVATQAGLSSPVHAVAPMFPYFGGTDGAYMPLDVSRWKIDLALQIPYAICEVELSNVLDLRLPGSREWFASQFRKGDGVLFTKRSEIPDDEWSFFSMWPTLISPSLGGNSVTDAIGAWLRLNGVSALIYPSARVDHFVHIRHGELIGSGGWNLVDYRDTAPSYSDYRNKVSARLNDISEWSLEVPSEVTISVAAPGSEWHGSWEVEGFEKFQLLLTMTGFRGMKHGDH